MNYKTSFIIYVLLLLFWGCAPQKIDNHVLSISPSSQILDQREIIQFRFEKPVNIKLREKTLAESLIQIDPSLPFNTTWDDAHTLTVTPLEDYQSSTPYTLKLLPPLDSIQGQTQFKWIHRPLQVNYINGLSKHDTTLLPTVTVFFHQDVNPDFIQSVCKIIDQTNQSHPLSLKKTNSDQYNFVSLEVKKPLAPEKSYSFVCKDDPKKEDDVPLIKNYSYPFSTVGPFTAIALSPSEIIPAFSDRTEIIIGFSNQPKISKEELREKLTIEPFTEEIYEGTFTHYFPYKYTVLLKLKEETKYTVSLKPGLQDESKQSMEKPLTFSFKTAGPEPELKYDTGQYALERTSEGFPVWAKNIHQYSSKCSSLPKQKIIRFLTSSLNYDPWYNAGSSSPYDHFEKLNVKTIKQETSITTHKNQWKKLNIPLHSICNTKNRSGFFYAEFDSKDLPPPNPNHYRYKQGVFANVTNLGVLLKAGPASGFVWVSQISDAKPVKDAKVTLYSTNGKLLFRGLTNHEGIVQFPGSTELLKTSGPDDKNEFEEDEYNYYYSEWSAMRAQRMIALVEKDDDIAVVDGNWANGIQLWNFGVSQERRSGPTELRVFIHTDRGLYRPGEKVHAKGWIRQISLGQTPILPKAKWAEIFIENVEGETLFRKRLKLSAFGGFDFDYELPKEARLGNYFITASIQKKNFRQKFLVEEFRKASFKVDLNMKERHVAMGKKISAQVDAQYLFGAPVPEAKVDWLVERRNHSLRFPKFPEYIFVDLAEGGYWYPYEYDNHPYLDFVSDGRGKTNSKGQFDFKFTNPLKGFSTPQDYIVNATVTDATDQSFSKQSVITSHPTDFYLGMHTQEYVQAIHMPFAVNLVALKPDGSQTATSAKLHYIQSKWECENNSGSDYHRNCKTKYENIWTRDIQIPATGTVTEKILPKQSGEFIIRAEAKDNHGNKVVASYSTYILGEGEAFWSGDESTRMSLITSKLSYEPGEVAKIVPKTHLQNFTALVTIERNGVLDSFIKHMKSASEGIEIPIKDAYAPNVFISVAAVTGRTDETEAGRPEFQLGISEIAVSPDHNRLSIQIETGKTVFEPRETVSGIVRVLSEGKPIVAEISVSAADEGVLQIIAYQTPDPMFKFYKNWGLGLDPSTNWNRILRLSPRWNIEEDRLGMDAGPTTDTSFIRSRFVSSAFWEPSLVTNKQGEAPFSFEAPDNLTSFRIMVAASDKAAKFGSGEKNITIRKPLLLKPVLPRFLTTGDKAQVGVMVHNYTEEPVSVEIGSQLKGVRPKSRKKELSLEHNSSKRVRFPIQAQTSSKATFQFEARAKLENGKTASDAFKMSIPTYAPLHKQTRSLFSGKIADKQSLALSWTEKADPKMSKLLISADTTGLSELSESFKYLVQYPYGCLEQTLSSLIPLFKVKDLAEHLNLTKLRGPKLQSFIDAGMAKIARHQHADGHFSFWPDSKTYPFLTVYALFGMVEAQKANVSVPKRTLDLAISAIKTWANQTASHDEYFSDLPMAAFLLAELNQADTGLIARLFDERKKLDIFGAAFLLRALHASNPKTNDHKNQTQQIETQQMNTLLSELETRIQFNQLNQHITLSSNDHQSYFGTSTRSLASLLSALLEVQPEHPWIDPILETLKEQKLESGRWYNTQDNLYALVALSDHARRMNQNETTLEISIPGLKPIKKKIQANKPLLIEHQLSKITQGAIHIQSSTPAYVSITVDETSKDEQLESIDQGFSLTRTFQISNQDHRNPNPEPLEKLNFQTGDIVEVIVKIQSHEEQKNVAIVVPLPAGLESTSQTKSVNSANMKDYYSGDSYAYAIWDRIEFRDDRVEVFADRMPAGEHNIHFQVRATLPGTFIARAAHAEAMYKPDVNGRTKKHIVQIK